MQYNIVQINKTFLKECEIRFCNEFSFLRGKKVFVYGSGVYGRFLKNALVRYGCTERIYAYINDFENGFVLDNIPVCSLEELDLSDNNCCVVVGIENSSSVVNRLTLKKIKFHVSSFYSFWNSVNLLYNVYQHDDLHWITNFDERIERFHQLKMNEEHLHAFYKDQKSHDVLQSRFDFYKTGFVSALENAPISPIEYFDEDYLSISDKEVYVDVGSFDGDSVCAFANYVKNKYQKIFAFEPDSTNFEKLKKNTIGLNNLSLHPYAVGKDDGNISFSSGIGEASSIADKGDSIVKLVKLDSFICEPVTFIKMDIEGAELLALHGAEKIIQTYRPKLAICVYHRVEDLLTIPTYLKSIVPEYRFKLRQHAASLVETILYAEV